METDRIVDIMRSLGYSVSRRCFSEIDLSADWRNVPVIYTSSEDTGSLYKSYIEDIMLALESLGAILVPGFIYLRAHHNKTFMEALRHKLFAKEANSFQSRGFGAYEELSKAVLDHSWPKVIKAAFGAGSQYVAKAQDRTELLAIAKKFSRSFSISEVLREYRSRLLWKGYSPRSLHRNKFVVQNFIPGLDGDFKVLKYGRRFYMLSRKVRDGDFRASGSGNFSFDIPTNVSQTTILDYAKSVTDQMNTPLCSLDIAFDGTRFYLIEYQCLHFGPLTAEQSPYHHICTSEGWEKVSGKCDLELVFCEAIAEHLAEKAS